MTKNRTPTLVYLDPGMHPGLEVKGLMDIRLQPNQNILICGVFTYLKPTPVFSKDLYYHPNEGSLMRELQL